jgi:transglutaminase-like putative cysteine protease
MGLTGLVAFAGGAGFEPISAALAALALTTALFWHPDHDLSTRMEKVFLPLAALLVARALMHVLVIQDDAVIPVVDLLLLLMAAEALRSLDAPNDVRLYALSFALVLASTAYRPGIVFLIAFVAYVMVATLALMVGHLRREAEAHKVRDLPLGGGLVATTGALSGVILAVALVVFVAFPRVSQGWAGRGETLATSIAGFSDQISIGQFGSTILGNPEIVLRIEFPEGPPEDIGSLHWRGRSYDGFDGIRWSRSSNVPPSALPRFYLDRWSAGVIEQKVFAAPLDVRVLFALHPAVSIEAENGIQPLFDNAGDHLYRGRGAPSYTAYSIVQAPGPDSLRVAEGFTPRARHYARLPNDLDQRIAALADSLTEGLDNSYDQTVAIQRYLQSLEYTRDLPATVRETTLEYFLFERQAGHCEYFSTAMAIMLRTLGIQTRNVNGFLGGQWSQFGDYLVVTQNEAHSWVEVWFPGYGWVMFDPTPAGAGGSSQMTSWFWPGRIFFDGLQHRWSKWVLDYDVEDQSGIFARWSGLLGSRATNTSDRPLEESTRSPVGVALLLLVLVVGILWARRGGAKFTPATHAYLQLREACVRADIGITPGLTPLALVARVREHRGTAGRAAERVVDLYLRARYGHEMLGESDLREMSEALGVARKTLRAKA